MGLVYPNLWLLIRARLDGAEFRDTATIGRQFLFLSRNGAKSLNSELPQFPFAEYCGDQYAERLLTDLLGCETVESFDYSDYEGCSRVLDMNEPIPAELHGKFDAVIDGGSLEHIFDVRTALENQMNLVKKGGRLFIFTTANNHMGHGFYQFSPELFFNVLSERNGFEIQGVFLHEHGFPGVEIGNRNRLFEVADPSKVRSRVGLVSSRPAMIMIHAIRKEIREVMKFSPVQSDYQREHAGDVVRHESMLKRAFRMLPKRLQDYAHGVRQRRLYSLGNSRFYKKVRR
jgi:SAM-dependent methyltransferase